MDNNNRIFFGLVGASNVLELPDEIHNKRLLQVLELSFLFHNIQVLCKVPVHSNNHVQYIHFMQMWEWISLYCLVDTKFH